MEHQIWLGTWDPPLASAISCENFQLFLAQWLPSMFSCRTSIRSPRITTRKVPSFATRLEGTLNQIQLQCPGRMTDLEAQQHLKDWLFHGSANTPITPSSTCTVTPSTSYSQLMVAVWKAESKNEDTWQKRRVRATVTTDLGEETAELDSTDCQIDDYPDPDWTGQWSL